jgi:anhydro-N-acetylmuramic acid kinase
MSDINEALWIIGLMSGTSCDGVAGGILYTDGRTILQYGPNITKAFPEELHNNLRHLVTNPAEMGLNWLKIERELTLFHAEVAKELINELQAVQPGAKISLIGFHGQTVYHNAAQKLTWQIGNSALLSELTGIDVISDYRRKDLAAGGCGAPLVPIYHAAIINHYNSRYPSNPISFPVVLVNIGGVGNVTYLGSKDDLNDMIAFDSGPGNAFIDDAMNAATGAHYDHNGEVASSGRVQQSLIDTILSDEYFSRKGPKSLDRNHFKALLDELGLGKLNLNDRIATLTALTAQSIISNTLKHKLIPQQPALWLICGGGRLNQFLLQLMQQAANECSERKVGVENIDNYSMNGDSVECYAFAYLAARSLYSLPLSYHNTTGTNYSTTGGALYRATTIQSS